MSTAKKISIIAAVDKQFGLGKNNQLLCYLPADLKYFKEITMGKSLIMGRKTYDSIGKPLPGRQNIIISRQMTSVPGTDIVSSLDEAISLAGLGEEIMIIGGASIYEQALPLVDTLYLTHIEHQFDADVWFPETDWSKWIQVHKEIKMADDKNCHNMIFAKYTKTEK